MRCIGPVLVLLILLPAVAAVAQLPADPLSGAERERATSIARRYAVERNLGASERLEWIGVELSNPKPAPSRDDRPRDLAPEAMHRHAVVTFFRYDRNDGLHVLVDLAGGNVVDTQPISASAVPLSAAEVERASRLALANETVQRMLGPDAASFAFRPRNASNEGNSVGGLRTVGRSPNDPRTRGRCVVLTFQRNGRFLIGRRVVVELLSNRVIDASMREGVRR